MLATCLLCSISPYHVRVRLHIFPPQDSARCTRTKIALCSLPTKSSTVHMLALAYMAISACNFLNSSSSSSSSCLAGFFCLTVSSLASILSNSFSIFRVYVRSPFAAAGNLCISSPTGTVPVFNILLSNCSCSISANSSSSSLSSTCSPSGADVIAFAISSPRACCSRSSSLCFYQQTILKSSCPVYIVATIDEGGDGEHVHSLVNLIDVELAVDLLHSLASLLHRKKSLAVDVCGFDTVDLLLQC